MLRASLFVSLAVRRAAPRAPPMRARLGQPQASSMTTSSGSSSDFANDATYSSGFGMSAGEENVARPAPPATPTAISLSSTARWAPATDLVQCARQSASASAPAAANATATAIGNQLTSSSPVRGIRSSSTPSRSTMAIRTPTLRSTAKSTSEDENHEPRSPSLDQAACFYAVDPFAGRLHQHLGRLRTGHYATPIGDAPVISNETPYSARSPASRASPSRQAGAQDRGRPDRRLHRQGRSRRRRPQAHARRAR